MTRKTTPWGPAGLALLLTAALVLPGCPTGDDDDDSTADATPRIQVTPATVEFGVVLVGDSAEADLLIANVGGAPLQIDGVQLADGTGPFTVQDYDGSVAAGAAVTLTVSLQADAPGPAADTIRIQSDDPDEPVVEVPVSVEDVTEVVGPGIDWTPASLTWGELPMDEAEVKTVTVSSVGTGELTVDSVELDGNSSADFTQLTTDIPTTVAPGDSFTVEIEYAPSDAGDDTGSLLLRSDDPDTPEVIIPLSGGLLPQPDIEVIPLLIDFGAMDVGLTASDAAVIHNLGQLDLSLGNLYLTGASDFSLEIDPSTQVLGPGEIAHVQVGWAPTVAGLEYATIYVPSDDPDESVVAIALQGEGLPLGEIDVAPMTADFGVVEVGSSAAVEILVTNVGSADLTLGGVGISVGAEVELTADPSYAAVSPGAPAVVALPYEPVDAGVDSGTLWIPSDDMDEPLIEIPIQGEGFAEQDIDLDPTTLDFGPLEAGQDQELSAWITNEGSADLNLGLLSLGGDAAFSLVVDPSSAAVAPGDDVEVEVRFAPVTDGLFSGFVDIPSDDPDESWVQLALSGEAFVLPDIEVDPPEVEFGLVDVGTSATEVIAVRNVGAGSLIVASAQLGGGGEMSFSAPDIPGVIPAGGQVDVEVTYTPVDEASDVGSLTFYSDDPDEPEVEVELIGDGRLFVDVAVSPATVDFGAVDVGDARAEIVQITNLGNDTLQLGGCSAGGDAAFSVTFDPCGAALAPGGTADLELTFEPDSDALFVGSVVVASDDPDTPQVTVALVGEGITPEIDVLPTQLDFGLLDIGQTSAMDLEIRNQGSADLELGGLLLDAGAEFGLDLDPSGVVLAPGDSTFATVSYTPVDLTPDSGELQIPSNDLDEPLVVVPVLGAHDPIADIHVDPALLDFGAVDVGVSATGTVTVLNQGTGDLWVDEPTLTGDSEFSLDTGAFPCTLGPGESAPLPVTYLPADASDDAATITVESDDPDQPSVQVALVGTPTPEPDIYVMPPSLSFGQVLIGDSASLTASITSVGSGDLELGTLTVTGSGEFSLITDPSGQILGPGGWTTVEVAYAPVDAGSDAATLEIPSNDPDEPVAVIELSGAEDPVPDIRVDPLDVDFGTVDQGLTASEVVTVSNQGTSTLTVTGISLTGSGDFSWTAAGIPGALSPGDSGTLTVTYGPSDLVADSGTLTLTSTDPDEAIVTVLLSGTATPEPAIELDPTPYDFGLVTLTCEESVDVAIRSVGGAPLTLTGYSLVEAAPGGAMTLDPGDLQDYVDLGWELDPGDEIEVTVSFVPDDLTGYDGLLTVSSDDPLQPDAEADIEGEGDAAGWTTDSFTQTGNSWVDVLWVVDNSCSMWDEQGQLGDDFSYFYEILEDAGVDYHIAVVSTDNADFQGANYTVIDNNTPNGAAEFEANCALGTNGSWVEKGLQYGYEALVDAQNNNPPNQGFWRDEALLLVIYVSDEADGSGDWSTYLSYYQGLKADPDDVYLSAICGTDGVNAVSCWGPGGSADAGYGYVDVANATGGILGSICDADWSQTMSEVGWLATANVIDTFELSEDGIPSSIEVSVNGAAVLTGWVFDEPLNSIVFDPAVVPAYGDTIEVYYGYYGPC